MGDYITGLEDRIEELETELAELKEKFEFLEDAAVVHIQQLEAELAEERLLTIEHAGTIMNLKAENERLRVYANSADEVADRLRIQLHDALKDGD